MESILWLPTISKHTTSQSARNNYVFLFYFRLFTINHKNNLTKHNVTQRETALLILLCEGQSCDREAEKVIIKVYLTKWQSNKDRREQTEGAGKNQGKDFQLPAKTREFFAMEMQALWNQFKHFKWKLVKVQRFWKNMPLHKYADWHNCLLNCFLWRHWNEFNSHFSRGDDSLTSKYQRVCLIWPSLYVLHAARLFWHVLGEPQGTESWVAAICPGDFTTLITPHGRGPYNQTVIWFPFRWICSVSSMIVSLAPVEQIAEPGGSLSSHCGLGLPVLPWSLEPHHVFTLTSTASLIS